MWKNYIPYVFLVEMSNNIADLDNNLAVSQKKINIPLLQNPAFTLGYLLPKKKKNKKHVFIYSQAKTHKCSQQFYL